jgi:tetratricopeptide (TPR) repeat protein
METDACDSLRCDSFLRRTSVSAGRNSIWIISPAADLGLLILTPLAIIPLVLWLANGPMTAEAIGLTVFAFASLGHHLPGLMRAYGDRELFAQFRWRFLLAPPLAVAVCWLSLMTFKLHGLELLLLLWATWHILMQTYGFLRIYDMKRGHVGRWHANWDFYACLTVFAAGFLLSDIRVFGIAETMSLAGVPLFGPELLAAARWLVGLATGAVLLGYLAVALRTGERVSQANWLKLTLLATTALLYWWSGNLSVNLLVGVAMFDIFHAIQYNAIVWYYNRRRAEKGGDRAGLLPWLFHARWWALPLYLVAIAAFGGLGWWGRSGGDASITSQVAMTLFAASAMLHFYYDGFIWKVSQPKTSENLSIASGGAASGVMASGVRASGVIKPSRHAVGWLAFGVVLLTLGVWEFRARPAEADVGRLAALARLTPEVPELQLRISQEALAAGRYQQSYDAAQGALQQRSDWFEAQLARADAALGLGRWQEAEQAYCAAADLRPADRSFQVQLAETYFRQGEDAVQQQQYQQARKILEQCLQMRPDHAQAHYQLGNVLLLTGGPAEAADHFRRCLESQPEFTEAYNNLGAALYQANELAEAADAYRHSISLRPEYAAAHYNLALVLISQGETTAARRSVLQAAALGQQPSTEVLRAVGF